MKLDLTALLEGVRQGDRAVLGRALTLIESRRADHRALAEELLEALLSETGKALRIGITGVPGVGKSTLIEDFGVFLADSKLKVAVLAIDPSSAISGGSILGDKTRMTRLSVHPNAFVRPTPNNLTLGGVARHTRETILLCEAAGFDVVLVETVGVGQSEISVSTMVDTVVLLLLPGAGDELQSIKRGILEQVDIVAINKADRDSLGADQAKLECESGLRLFPPTLAGWHTPVLAISGLTGRGRQELWSAIQDHRRALEENGELAKRRAAQAQGWLRTELREQLWSAFERHPEIKDRLNEAEAAVKSGNELASRAATRLLQKFMTTRA